MLAQAIALSLEAERSQQTTQQPSVNGLGSTADSRPSSGLPQPSPPSTSAGAGEKGELTEEAAKIAQAILAHREPDTPQVPTATLPAAKVMREWQPNRECLDLVMGMGISENAARRALYNTGNDNAELATSWVFENIDNPDLHKPFHPPPLTAAPPQTPEGGLVWHSFDEVMGQEVAEASKMVFVVNMELKMGVGKIAAQVGHATLALYRLVQTQPNWKEACTKWDDQGSRKIVLQGLSTHHLLELKHKAYGMRLPSIIVHDAGKTQVEPGSLTVLAVFGTVPLVDQVTGSLKLL